MNWEQELLSLFNDELLADVRPLAPKTTADDRLTQSFLEINQWIEFNKREPLEDCEDFKEKILYRRLRNFRGDVEKNSYLKDYDQFNLLKDGK